MSRARGPLTALATLLLALLLAGCGGSEEPELTVAAAPSLRAAFEAYGDEFDAARVRLAFAGSDELAAQIRQGVRPDVYAAANTALPEELFAEGLVGPPVVFSTNSLVLAVPADSTIEALEDLTRPGTAIVLGSPSVPIGAYTQQALGRLPDAGGSILANVRSEEPDVSGIVGKLTLGAADAGFLYSSDVEAAGGRLRAIPLPAELQPEVEYGAAVVEGAEDPQAAREFIDGLRSGSGARALRAAGLGPPAES